MSRFLYSKSRQSVANLCKICYTNLNTVIVSGKSADQKKKGFLAGSRIADAIKWVE